MNETKNYVPNFQRKSNEYNLSKSILLKNDGLVSLEDVLSGAVKISQFHIMQFHIVDIRNLKQVTMGEKNKKSSKPTSCERLVKLYCPRSKGPYNVAALIVTSGVQSKDDRSFWGIANEARDNGKLGEYYNDIYIFSMKLHLILSNKLCTAPGQLVLLSSIDQVSKWMNNGQLPVIETKRPMMPLLNNLKSKPTPLIKLAGVTSAAVLLVEVETEQVYFVNAGCSCCLCNGMSLFDNGMLRQDICACYGKRITANRQILVMDLTLVEKKTGMTRKIKEVCNRDFQDTFITEGANAQNQHCDILNANQGFMYDVAKATKAVFEKGNKDGWLCCVHFKVGEIVDGVESNQNPTYGQTQEKVQSTNLVLHLSRFELAEPTAHPEAEWKKLKVNIQDCLKKNDVNQSSDEEETEENE